MKIYLDQIPDSGLQLNEFCAPARLGVNSEEIKFTEPIRLSAQITKGINNVAVRLTLNATMHLNCSRCLEEFTAPLSQKIEFNFPIKNQKELDLSDNLREEIILNYPLKPLCRPDCLGLCLSCGQNLNQGQCNCGT